MSDFEDKNFPQDELIGYLCHKVVPELFYEDLQRQACHEELERLKSKLHHDEMTSIAMRTALKATGLSQHIPPSLAR